MRKITHFHAKGGSIVRSINSITGQKSCTTWSGKPKRFWIPWNEGSLQPDVVYLLEPDEPEPSQTEGWANALGFFG